MAKAPEGLVVRAEYAPGYSPLNLPPSMAWVSLEISGKPGKRVRSYTTSRGRQDATGAFEAGTATIVLDGTDGQLDPLVSSSLFGSGNSAPGTPIRIIVNYQGVDYTRFTGFMWPDGPAPTSDRKSRDMQVTVTAQDYLGWASDHPMPDCEWSAWVASCKPDIWLRGQANFDGLLDPAIPGSYTVFNYGYGSQTFGHTGTNDVHAIDSIISGTQDPGLRVEHGGRLVASAAVTTGGSLFTAALGFQQMVAGGSSTTLIECNGAHVQWRIYYDNTGKVFAQYYDSTGTLLAAAQTTTGNAGDGNPHWVIAAYSLISGVTLYSDLDGTPRTASTGASSMAGSTGTITVMQTATGSSNCAVQGVAYFQNTLAPAADNITVDGTTGVNTLGGLYNGDSAADRLANTQKVAQVLTSTPATVNVSGAWTFGGYRNFGSHGAALTAIGTSMGGTTWVQLDGQIRIRDFQALADATYAAYYATELAVLTDDNAASGTPVRSSSPTRTGAKPERIINSVDSTVQLASYADATKLASATSLNKTSVRAYGAHSPQQAVDSDTTNLDLVVAYTDDLVTQYAGPVTELGTLTVDLWTSANARDWVLGITNPPLELETAFHWREATADNAHVPLDDTYRVNHIDESFAGTTWSASVNAAPA